MLSNRQGPGSSLLSLEFKLQCSHNTGLDESMSGFVNFEQIEFNLKVSF